MIVLARGSITNPDELPPFVDDEMRVIKQRKDDGVIKTVYRRAAGPGTFLILEGETIDAIRERVETLPFVVEGLMTLEYDEIYAI
jgi:hypothetical protein